MAWADTSPRHFPHTSLMLYDTSPVIFCTPFPVPPSVSVSLVGLGRPRLFLLTVFSCLATALLEPAWQRTFVTQWCKVNITLTHGAADLLIQSQQTPFRLLLHYSGCAVQVKRRCVSIDWSVARSLTQVSSLFFFAGLRDAARWVSCATWWLFGKHQTQLFSLCLFECSA